MKQYKYAPLQEMTLRRYEKPEANMQERELKKRICLSLGLLQPGDSRDVVVDVLSVLLAAARERRMLTSDAIQEGVIAERNRHKLPLLGIAPSNVRRQVRRMRDLLLVEKIKNQYRITEFMDLKTLFEDKIMKYVLPQTLARIREYLELLDSSGKA